MAFDPGCERTAAVRIPVFKTVLIPFFQILMFDTFHSATDCSGPAIYVAYPSGELLPFADFISRIVKW